MAVDKGLTKYVFCFTQRNVFWALLFCLVFNILGVIWPKREGGGTILLVWKCFFLSAEANWQDKVIMSDIKARTWRSLVLPCYRQASCLVYIKSSSFTSFWSILQLAPWHADIPILYLWGLTPFRKGICTLKILVPFTINMLTTVHCHWFESRLLQANGHSKVS